MNKKIRYYGVVNYLLCLFLVSFTPLAYSRSVFDEVNSDFTYRGKPIDPLLVMKLSTREYRDDRPPVVVTVDVVAGNDINAGDSNYSKIEKVNGGWKAGYESYVYPEKEQAILTDRYGFWYKWVGKLANGWHVLETGYDGGGSGLFMDVMFIKVSQGEIIYSNEHHARQILLTVMRTDRLGDRYDGDIKVYPYKVVIPASCNPHIGGESLDTELTINFEKENKPK
ncbi:MAG: hypothetical protein HQL30_03860 [Candidatus Omnitrophica bacterium]|nr:hypothetical protein [Candidatus Omnitrophota bacterium]